jgi:hypothetical protein
VTPILLRQRLALPVKGHEIAASHGKHERPLRVAHDDTLALTVTEAAMKFAVPLVRREVKKFVLSEGGPVQDPVQIRVELVEFVQLSRAFFGAPSAIGD